MPEWTAMADVRRVLSEARTIAVLGAHEDLSRPAGYVPAYLAGQGYRILPVNPLFVGKSLFGETVVGSLADLRVPVDIVDVFRRSELLPGHVEEIAAMTPRPRTVWLQMGIRNAAFAEAIERLGIDVVQDRCTLADHRAWGLGRVG